MGYRCPVCDAEEIDAVHLANHLAVTASLGRPDHRDWLEEHAPNWGECGPEELGEIVSEHATEVETPEFDGHAHQHQHQHEHAPGRPSGLEGELARQSRQPGRGASATTGEAEQVLREARELTRQMQTDSPKGSADEDREGEKDRDENENA